MKLVDRLILKELVPALIFSVAIFASLWFAGGPIQDATKYLGQGVPLPIVLHLVTLSIAPVLSYTLPMGVLLAVLLGFGRLSSDSEAVALSAGGIPFWRVMAPAALLGLLASFVGYAINDRVASSAAATIADIKQNVLHDPGETAKPFDFPIREHGVLVLLVHVEKGFDGRTLSMRQVTITTFDPQGHAVSIEQAESARYLTATQWVLHGATITKLGQDPIYASTPVLRTKDLHETPANVAFMAQDPDTLNFSDLRRQIRELQQSGTAESATIRDAEVKLWSKIALPFACLVFAVVGSPLGLRPQRSSKTTGGALAILIIFGYYVLFTGMKSVAQGGGCSPVLAAFLPDVMGLLAGLYLSWRASL